MAKNFIGTNVRSNSLHGILKARNLDKKRHFLEWVVKEKIMVKFTGEGYAVSRMGSLVGHFIDADEVVKVLQKIYKEEKH
jgi:site-specific recombinase XerC